MAAPLKDRGIAAGLALYSAFFQWHSGGGKPD